MHVNKKKLLEILVGSNPENNSFVFSSKEVDYLVDLILVDLIDKDIKNEHASS